MQDQILQAGFGQVDITPATDGTFRVLDPIFMRALHLRQGGRQVTFLAADLFLLNDAFMDLVARHLAGSGVDVKWILPGASHLGTGPTLDYHYVLQPTPALRHFGRDDFYARAAAEAIRLAVADLDNAQLGIGASLAPADLSFNRRAYDDDGKFVFVSMSRWLTPPEHLHYKPHDRQLGVLYLARSRRRPIALINFGAHALADPKLLGHISGEFCGRLCQRLAADGIDALFFQAGLGDVHPNRVGDDPIDHLTSILHTEVRSLIEQIDPRKSPPMLLSQAHIDVPLAHRPDGVDAKLTDNVQRYRAWLAERFRGQSTYRYRMRAVRFGAAGLLHMPGELFSATAIAIRDAAPLSPLLVLSSPCGEAGYLATPTAHEEGENEAILSTFAADSEPMIRQAAIDFVNMLRSPARVLR